jgi:hypothetical protein
MWDFGDYSVILEQDVLGQIREDYHISTVLLDQEIRRNEKSRSILARGRPSLEGNRTNPKAVFVIVDGIFLQGKGLYSTAAKASLLVFAIDQGYEGSTCSQAECCQLCEGCQGTVWRRRTGSSRRRLAGLKEVLQWLVVPSSHVGVSHERQARIVRLLRRLTCTLHAPSEHHHLEQAGEGGWAARKQKPLRKSASINRNKHPHKMGYAESHPRHVNDNDCNVERKSSRRTRSAGQACLEKRVSKKPRLDRLNLVAFATA